MDEVQKTVLMLLWGLNVVRGWEISALGVDLDREKWEELYWGGDVDNTSQAEDLAGMGQYYEEES
jgi:hypothetical protein